MCNGDVYPCCSQAGTTPLLFLGNIKELGLEQIIKNFNSNMCCRMISTEGLSWFVNIVNDNNLNIELKDNYVNNCDLCNTIFAKEEYNEVLRPYLQNEKKKIYQKYIMQKANE